ncbi:hypothetical protein H6F50_17245 [Coleofasciculus sp. FACHB-712]|uniref:hypothetical protein n=1 Tax=Cyanophyceae TaxID=3028117 RepID=UPI001687627D|nr:MULTISPECIES: hypothetical protein [unclassified Coleofasciculus]MBD1899275.1 hypothetical protein [Coleofasciculus sp. FACHB-125]MBD1944085.1 hypothetical protein [Coleofasciculus sp. FACHB-712]
MVDPMDDIAKQARQGSVAAIIQILNDKLAEAGVRTRAIFADGVLQLLCEAATPDQLEQSSLVQRIRQILESISPRNIRRVNINSRIVREQQLLWLEEIHRDPESQLLWAEEITLAKPNVFRRLGEDFKGRKPAKKSQPPFPQPSSRFVREKRQFWRGIVGGASLSLLLLLVGWALYDWLGPFTITRTPASAPNSSPKTTAPATSSAPVASSTQTTALPSSDPFADAVRLAEQTSIAGRNAQTSAQWLDLAAKWQQASDLMAAVPPSDSRYGTAQDRVESYRKKSEIAQQEAKKRRS